MPPVMERTEHTLITDGVWEHEQTLEASRPFWVFFVTNLAIATWLMGVLLAGMGFDFANAVFVLLLGSIIGSLFPTLTALIGPKSQLSQIEVSRLSLGREGKKLPGFLNWINCIGWDAVNNILSTAALIALLGRFGISCPFWLALAFLVALQVIIGVYGHHFIQQTSKYTGALQGVFFVIIGIIALQKTHGAMPAVKTTSLSDLSSGIALIAAYNLTWIFLTADYTRYMPKKTLSRTVFFTTFAGLSLSLFVLAFFGFVTATLVTDQTPDGVMKALEELSGPFAPLVLLLIAFNSTPSNAVNDNSAAYSLMSAGFKISRPTSAVFGAALGYVICLFANAEFGDIFENFISLFADLMMPWAAILLVHWFAIHKTERRTPSGITIGFIIFVVTAALSIALFSSNTLYTGLLSADVDGVDIGPYVGFLVAGAAYYVVFKIAPSRFVVTRKKNPGDDAAMASRRRGR